MFFIFIFILYKAPYAKLICSKTMNKKTAGLYQVNTRSVNR